MKTIVSLIISTLIFFGAFLSAHAQTPLSGDDIRHFIKAMEPLQKLGKKYNFSGSGAGLADGLNPADFFPMSEALKNVKNHEGYIEFQIIIRKAGFSSPEKWASIGDRIMRAYVFSRIARRLTPKKIQEIQGKMAAIEKNEYLTPQIRKKILDNMKQTIAIAHKMPNNIAADQGSLKPFSAKLKRLFEEQK